MGKKAIAIERTYGRLCIHLIIPISELPYTPPPQYSGKIPNSVIEKVASPVWLSSTGVSDTRKCLRIQGLEPSDYITPATVHGEWKVQKHQGIVYAIKSKDVTDYANPSKPIPASWEVERLFENLLMRIKNNIQLPAERLFDLLISKHIEATV